MINLLPQENQKELLQEYRWKLIMILGLVFLCFLICFSLILLSIKISVAGEASVQKTMFLQKESDFNKSNGQALQNEIESINGELSKIESFYRGQIGFVDILERVSGCLPPGSYLINISVGLDSLPNKEQGTLVSIFGFCPTRDKLLLFKENLEKEKSFTEINFPSFNWVKMENVNFSVTFKVK